MNCQTATSPLPPPPDAFYNKTLLSFFPTASTISDSATERLSMNEVQMIEIQIDGKETQMDQDYLEYVWESMSLWGIRSFTFDWASGFDDCYNQIISQFFIKVWIWGLMWKGIGTMVAVEVGGFKYQKHILMAVLRTVFLYLQSIYHKIQKDLGSITTLREKNTKYLGLKRFRIFFWFMYQKDEPILFMCQKLIYHQDCLVELGMKKELVAVFKNKYAFSDDELRVNSSAHVVKASWFVVRIQNWWVSWCLVCIFFSKLLKRSNIAENLTGVQTWGTLLLTGFKSRKQKVREFVSPAWRIFLSLDPNLIPDPARYLW